MVVVIAVVMIIIPISIHDNDDDDDAGDNEFVYDQNVAVNYASPLQVPVYTVFYNRFAQMDFSKKRDTYVPTSACLNLCSTLRVTRHMSNGIRYTSHITRHKSHVIQIHTIHSNCPLRHDQNFFFKCRHLIDPPLPPACSRCLRLFCACVRGVGGRVHVCTCISLARCIIEAVALRRCSSTLLGRLLMKENAYLV